MELDTGPSRVKEAMAAARRGYGFYILRTVSALGVGLLSAGTAGYFVEANNNISLKREVQQRDVRIDAWLERYSAMMDNYIDLAKDCSGFSRY